MVEEKDLPNSHIEAANSVRELASDIALAVGVDFPELGVMRVGMTFESSDDGKHNAKQAIEALAQGTGLEWKSLEVQNFGRNYTTYQAEYYVGGSDES